MSKKRHAQLEQTGTRFRVYARPPFLPGQSILEDVVVSTPPSVLKDGLCDDRMIVIDAVGKVPYTNLQRPPYRGKTNPPVKPGPNGHFTHLAEGTREFACAALYATVRRVLDIWERYLDDHIAWHFETEFERLELIPLVEWAGAQSGYGFLEMGYGPSSLGTFDVKRPFWQSVDAIAHEVGHAIVYAEVGVPAAPDDPAIDYAAMHEASGDLVALISALHFDTTVTRLLDATAGDLFTMNELDRIGELADQREVRRAFNNLRMSDVAGAADPHVRAAPLTGGIFDVLVEVFQKKLVSRRLITASLAKRATPGPNGSTDASVLAPEFRAAYDRAPDKFKEALIEARDYLGALLAATWRSLDPNYLTLHTVLRALMRADRKIGDGHGMHAQTIRECFAWREITAMPGSVLLRPHTMLACGLEHGRGH